MDIRHANDTAQKAFRRMLEHHLRTGEWDAGLIADWSNAERVFDETPEWMLDAQHDAVMAEIEELADRDLGTFVPDVPLALDSYWNRGA